MSLPSTRFHRSCLTHEPRRLPSRIPLLLWSVFLLSWIGCQGPRKPSLETAFFPDKLEAIDQAINQAIGDHRCPGAVFWLETQATAYHRAYGNQSVLPAVEPMTEETVFDLASLTKVIATAPSILLLVEHGLVQLDAPVGQYLPEFVGDGRDQVTVRHLLTHTSGLRPGISLSRSWDGYEAGIAQAVAESPTRPPDTAFRYSDVNFILLGEIVHRVDGRRLDSFAQEEIFDPLGMTHTTFNPNPEQTDRIAPTTETANGVIRGVVHDGTARRMDGVAGHAGLFSTAADLARFARTLLNGGSLDGVPVFRPETVLLMTQVQTPDAVRDRRALGWDIDSPYAGPRGAHFPIGSYGHTGWTGTSLWIDPFSQSFVILLSNRNHPTEAGNVIALRRQVGTLAAEAIRKFNFIHVPGALPVSAQLWPTAPEPLPTPQVLTGIDILKRDDFRPLRGLRVGLVTNHTGTDRNRQPTIDLLHESSRVSLQAIFSPEHGLRGVADERVGDDQDAQTGLPVYSLYGETRKPTPEQLAGLDALVFDIQDIGCRFYTYISTMGLCLEAAAEHHLRFFVLDRPNPINGFSVEGPVYEGESRFTAFHALPVRHGMTVGELALLFAAERELAIVPEIVELESWARELWFDQTQQPWINPSPNMRSLKQAILYPGVGLLESAMSVGRGTDTPFEVVGAPYVDDTKWALALNNSGLPGVRFIPIRFTPTASVFAGKACRGVYLLLTDRDQLNAVDVGITLALTLERLYPDQFALDRLNPLLQNPSTIEAIEAGSSLNEIRGQWQTDLARFQARRKNFLLYP